jgi:hypothetical protein
MTHTLNAKVKVTPSGSAAKPPTESVEARVIFGNLVVVDSNPDPALPWLHETVSLAFSCRLDHAQSGTCTVKYEVLSARNQSEPLVTRIFKDVPRPGFHSWVWDGKSLDGSADTTDLYVYRITAESTDSNADADTNRSPYLRFRYPLDGDGKPLGESEYMTLDDGGTPEAEGDDVCEYATTFMVIDDLSKSAKSGQLVLYVPDVKKVASWEIPALECLMHKNKYDGLIASKQGVSHKLLIRIPARFVEYGGEYLYVNRYLDDHADRYKDHKPKPALDWY